MSDLGTGQKPETRGWGPAVQRPGVKAPAWAGDDPLVAPGERTQRQEMARVFMNHVFGWMAAGLTLSGALAWAVYDGGPLYEFAQPLFFPLIIAELVLVFALSATLHKLKAGTAAGLFLLYAALNGLTLGVIVDLYTATSVARVFFITAGSYGAMAFIGLTTKRDLSGMGSFLMMGVIALIITMVVNMFLASTALDWAVSVIGVLLFAGLTAYDVQKFKKLGYLGFNSSKEASRMAIAGALNLYLDFINMFLFLLRLFGDRR